MYNVRHLSRGIQPALPQKMFRFGNRLYSNYKRTFLSETGQPIERDVFVGRVLENEDITQDDQVHRLVIKTDPDIAWKPGQAVKIVTPLKGNHSRNGKAGYENEPHVAEYSIASANRLEILVRRFLKKKDFNEHEEKALDANRQYVGRASNFLCDSKIDDPVEVMVPDNETLVLKAHENLKNVLFISGGTGIAPVLAHLSQRKDSPGATVILNGARDERNLLQRNVIEEFAYQTPNGKLLVAYSSDVPEEKLVEKNNPAKPKDQKKLGQDLPDLGYKKKAYVQDWVKERADSFVRLVKDPDTLVLFCGGPAMLRSFENTLKEICQQSGEDWDKLKADLIEQGRWKIESA